MPAPLAFLLLAASLAAAPSPAPEPAAPVTPAAAAPAPPAPPAPTLAPSALEVRYQAARAAMLRGELGAAADGFAAVAADPEAGPLAAPARELASACRDLSQRGRFLLQPPPGAAARLDRSGRAELALYQTLHGAWLGVGIAEVADLSDSKLVALLAVAGAGAGLGGSLVLSRDVAMSTGRADAIDSATSWGTFNGALVAGIAGASSRTGVGSALAGGLGGLFLTAAATSVRAPGAGDVAVVNSGGIWGLAAGGCLIALVDPSSTGARIIALVAADAGLITMALLAPRLEVSRGRSLLIDAGGVVGVLAGLTVPVLAGSDDRRVYAVAGLAGMAGGLGLTAWLSRDWDAEERGGLALAPAVLPLQDRRLAFGLAGRF